MLRVVLEGAGISIPYNKSHTDTGQAGCEFSSRDGWNRTGNEDVTAQVGTSGGYSHVIKLPGLYPEVIRGQQTVTEKPNSNHRDSTSSSHVEHTTTWSWNLRRVDPGD